MGSEWVQAVFRRQERPMPIQVRGQLPSIERAHAGSAWKGMRRRGNAGAPPEQPSIVEPMPHAATRRSARHAPAIRRGARASLTDWPLSPYPLERGQGDHGASSLSRRGLQGAAATPKPAAAPILCPREQSWTNVRGVHRARGYHRSTDDRKPTYKENQYVPDCGERSGARHEAPAVHRLIVSEERKTDF